MSRSSWRKRPLWSRAHSWQLLSRRTSTGTRSTWRLSPKLWGYSICLCKNKQTKKKNLTFEAWILSVFVPLLSQITQIGLSAFHVICLSVFLAKDLGSHLTDIASFIMSILVSQSRNLKHLGHVTNECAEILFVCFVCLLFFLKRRHMVVSISYCCANRGVSTLLGCHFRKKTFCF